MKIADREIGGDNPPYIVAEISGNHCGDFDLARRLVATAATAGADAVKLQCYTPDSITLDSDKPDFIIKDGPWKGRKLYELYQKAHTPPEWFPELFKIAEILRITIFASVFDHMSIEFLESLGCPAYKIASMEIVDIPLIKHAKATGKPVIVSTGMASSEEIEDVIDLFGYDDDQLALLQCVSGYPSLISEANLHRLNVILYERYYPFDCPRGISDHTASWEFIPVAATALGASIIEKHLMLSKDDPCEDKDFSLTPAEFKSMVSVVRNIWHALQPSEAASEESSRQARRSLYVTQDMSKGEEFSPQNVRSIRPAYGLPPKYLPMILGRKSSCNIERGTALTWELVEGIS